MAQSASALTVALGFLCLTLLGRLSVTAQTTTEVCSNPGMFWGTYPPTFAEPIEKIPAFNNAIYQVQNNASWGQYNNHDATPYQEGSFYYTIGTDVMVGYGDLPRRGIQMRRSPDLVHWTFIGWVLPDTPAWAKQAIFKGGNGGIWAPDIIKLSNGTLVIYYCVSEIFTANSAIGIASSTTGSILGPWIDRGMIFRTYQGNSSNAIDPSVFYTPSGTMWMAYGSGGTAGIWIKQLDPNTGLPLSKTDLGKRIAYRGPNTPNMEAPNIVYRSGFYYLFVSYDWLGTDYNIRVARSLNPDGPYYDMNGNDMAVPALYSGTKIVNQYSFNEPGVTAPYGWVGLGHQGVLTVQSNRSEGRFELLFHNARPASASVWMHMHVRRLLWTEEGWPAALPTRYGGEDLEASLPTPSSWWGTYEHISFPAAVNLNFTPVIVKLGPCGTGYWPVTYVNPGVGIIPFGGEATVKVMFHWGWDPVRSRKTVVYTGFEVGGDRAAVWGIRVDDPPSRMLASPSPTNKLPSTRSAAEVADTNQSSSDASILADVGPLHYLTGACATAILICGMLF